MSGDPRDVVARKRDGLELGTEELRGFILSYARGEVPDHLAAAFLMAAFIRGLSARETLDMTTAMVDSGITLPLAGVSRPKVDKHSTGGVSDSVTLVFVPLVAALGMAVAKLSGRGLGHTGGTLDKLEAIPGLRTELAPDELERQVERVGCAVAGQTADLVPADRALYALRDATATVASIPLIAASVMSKKLAVGTDLLVLDVKVGSGAFMKTVSTASDLARTCVDLARAWGRQAHVAVTDMSQPLGTAIGNALDVAEAVRILRAEEAGRLWDLSRAFAVDTLETLSPAGAGPAAEAVDQAVSTGRAAETFARMVEAQGGDPRVVDDPWSVLPRAPVRHDVPADREGVVASVDAEALGRAALYLGAGRRRKDEPIDPAVGLEFLVDVGDVVEVGRPLAVIHARDEEAAAAAARTIGAAIAWSGDPVSPPPLVHGRWTTGDA